jgi:hypothetical protein
MSSSRTSTDRFVVVDSGAGVRQRGWIHGKQQLRGKFKFIVEQLVKLEWFGSGRVVHLLDWFVF